MKPFVLFICLVFLEETTAQKVMKLDSTLKANSEALPVKIKGGIMVGTIMKYQFGPHKVISAKAGWGKGTARSRWFSNIETSKSKSKTSFVFVSNEKDTLEVNISINTKSQELRKKYLSFNKGDMSIEREEDPSKVERTENIAAVITAADDKVEWSLVYISRLNTDSSQIPQKYGVLTDSITVIEISEVSDWEDGKSRKLYLTKGFVFYKDGKAVAAVQSPMDTFQNKFVWMKNDLDAKIKNVLAAAVVVMMSYNFL